MKKTLVGVMLLTWFGLVGCSGSSNDKSSTSDPASACKAIDAELCAKVFGCYTKAEQDQAAMDYGNNESDCNTKLNDENCGAEMLKCDSGTSYDSGAAADCLNQLKSLSCKEYTDPSTATPAACMSDAICH